MLIYEHKLPSATSMETVVLHWSYYVSDVLDLPFSEKELVVGYACYEATLARHLPEDTDPLDSFGRKAAAYGGAHLHALLTKAQGDVRALVEDPIIEWWDIDHAAEGARRWAQWRASL